MIQGVFWRENRHCLLVPWIGNLEDTDFSDEQWWFTVSCTEMRNTVCGLRPWTQIWDILTLWKVWDIQMEILSSQLNRQCASVLLRRKLSTEDENVRVGSRNGFWRHVSLKNGYYLDQQNDILFRHKFTTWFQNTYGILQCDFNTLRDKYFLLLTVFQHTLKSKGEKCIH